MTNFQQCRQALTGSACPKKAIKLFYVSHPKVLKAAERGRVVMRNPSAVVTSHLVESDDFTHWHAVNNAQVMRFFAGAAQGAA